MKTLNKTIETGKYINKNNNKKFINFFNFIDNNHKYNSTKNHLT
jgi:hypothetical protein